MFTIKPNNKIDLNKTILSLKLNHSKKELNISIKQFCAVSLVVVVAVVGGIYSYGKYRINTELLNKIRNDLQNVSTYVEEQYDAEIKELEKKTEEIEKQFENINSSKDEIKNEINKIDSTATILTEENSEVAVATGTAQKSSDSRINLLSQRIDNLGTLVSNSETEFTQAAEEVTVLVNDILSKPSLFPTNGMISSEFGYRSETGSFHDGVDIRAPKGTPIVATASGTVEISGNAPQGYSGYGNVIVINHGSVYKTLYAHNVEKGEVIGYVGCTGYSTGNHVHYEVTQHGELQNPRNFF